MALENAQEELHDVAEEQVVGRGLFLVLGGGAAVGGVAERGIWMVGHLVELVGVPERLRELVELVGVLLRRRMLERHVERLDGVKFRDFVRFGMVVFRFVFVDGCGCGGVVRV